MGPTAAIILGAGASTRMGQPKALLRVRESNDQTFAAAIFATARAAGAGEIVFVLGPPHGEAIAAALPAGARTAWNPDPARGMLSSVQAGLAALQQGCAAALVWPVDQPWVSRDTARAIIAAPADRIALPVHGGRGGHPLRVPADLFPSLMALPLDRGLRGLLQDHPDRVLRIEVPDPGAVTDADTPADYARALRP